MGRHWQYMGNYNAETTTYSEITSYTPPIGGRLIGVRLLANRAAATTLINGVVIKLSSGGWSPNSMEFGIVGGNLQTVPIAAVPMADYSCDQPVATTPIKIEGKNISESDTPVTVSILIMGLFESPNS